MFLSLGIGADIAIAHEGFLTIFFQYGHCPQLTPVQIMAQVIYSQTQ
jgi:hypothetical protein